MQLGSIFCCFFREEEGVSQSPDPRLLMIGLTEAKIAATSVPVRLSEDANYIEQVGRLRVCEIIDFKRWEHVASLQLWVQPCVIAHAGR